MDQKIIGTKMKKLVVFDLDFTLWNAGGTWCDHTNPPYTKVNGYVEDSMGSRIILYPDVKKILNKLADEGIPMALASRTGAPTWANQLLQLFEIDIFFKYKEIYPGSKTEHFNQLQHVTNIPFEDMVFFDDETRNISDVGSLGVEAVYVEDGVHWGLVRKYVYSL